MGDKPIITDPGDSNFNPEQFRFEHYSGEHANNLSAALLKMFPPGTKHSYIDKILVNKAGMRSTKAPSSERYTYLREHTSTGGWMVFIAYDEKDQSKVFYAGSTPL